MTTIEIVYLGVSCGWVTFMTMLIVSLAKDMVKVEKELKEIQDILNIQQE